MPENDFNWDDYEDVPDKYASSTAETPFNLEMFQDAIAEPNFVERQDRKGAVGVGQDVGEGVWDLWSNLIPGISGLYEGAGQVEKQALGDPSRFAQNTLGSLGEYGSQLGNIPQAAGKYIESRRDEEDPFRGALMEHLPKMLQSLSFPSKPSPMQPNENLAQQIWGSLHLPKPGQFDYAQALGKEPAQNLEQAETDKFITDIFPMLMSGPGVGGQQLGAENNPFGFLTAQPIAQTAAAGIKSIPKLSGQLSKVAPEWLTKEKAGKSVGEPAKALKNELENKYNQMIEKAANENVIADIPRHTFKEIKDTYPGLPDDTVRLIDKAFRTGEFKDLHKADVQLGRNKQDNFKDITGKIIKQNAFDNATKVESKIKGYMEKALEKNSPELAKEWFENKNTYAKELGPLLDIPAIREYTRGDLSATDLTRLLQSNTKSGKLFRARMADEYKAIGQNKFKNKLAELGLKGGVLAKFMSIVGG